MFQDDPDKVFPVHCKAAIPDCSGTYLGQPRELVCSAAASPSWVELL